MVGETGTPSRVRFTLGLRHKTYPLVSSRFSDNLWVGKTLDGVVLVAAANLRKEGKLIPSYHLEGNILIFDYKAHTDFLAGRIIFDSGSARSCRVRATHRRSGWMRTCVSCGVEFHGEERRCPRCGTEPGHYDIMGNPVSREEEARDHGHGLDP